MIVKVFILGRPGSGKSTSAHYIATLAESKGWSSIHINDYEILREMFLADTEHKQFRSTACDGFDVLDFSVLDTALKKVERRVQEYMLSRRNEIILIEFARDDYDSALKQFSRNFLQDSYFLFIDVDVDTCLWRIHERVAHRATVDDHPSLSDASFRSYYGKDNRDYIYYKLKKQYHISKSVEIIDNTDSWENFTGKVNRFVNIIFARETPCWDKAFSRRELSSRKPYSLIHAYP